MPSLLVIVLAVLLGILLGISVAEAMYQWSARKYRREQREMDRRFRDAFYKQAPYKVEQPSSPVPQFYLHDGDNSGY